MTSKPAFKTVFTIIITAIFGYIMYMLVDSVMTGYFFMEETDTKLAILSAAAMGGPIVLTIICSIIRRRYLWLLSIANLIFFSIVSGAAGDETTMLHAYACGAMIVVPYILCLIIILREKKEYKPEASSGYGSSSSYGGYSGSSSGSMSFKEKQDYILHNCHSAYSTTAMEKIENDPNLTASQKAEMKDHLFYYGD